MNLRYRINQLRNTLFSSHAREKKWVLIHGVPRSGTTYMYHEFMKASRYGVSDWDLRYFAEAIGHVRNEQRIAIDSREIVKTLRSQMEKNAAPGGGHSYDFVVKQVNITKPEFDLFCEIMAKPPKETYFLFREPALWFSSAIKKFGLDKEQALKLYKDAMNSYQVGGGKILEYGASLGETLLKHPVLVNYPSESFSVRNVDQPLEDPRFEEVYMTFKATHLSGR